MPDLCGIQLETTQNEKKLQKAKDGEWKKDDSLNVLCAKKTAICADNAEALCYSDHNRQSIIPVDNFGKIKRYSVSVCSKEGTVLDSQPVCEEGTEPVCGHKKDVTGFIAKNSKPVCGMRVKEGGSTQSVLCPFGGTPVCVKEGWNLEAYCVNDKNFILSDKWSTDEYHDIGGHGDSRIKSMCSYQQASVLFYEPAVTMTSSISCSGGEKSVPKCYFTNENE